MLDSPRIRSPSLGPPNNHGHGTSTGLNGKGRKSGLRARGTQLLALRFGWVVLVIWFEVGDFFHSLSTCRFPDTTLRRSNPSLKEAPTHVVLLADTHVPHPILSYPPDSRLWVNWIKQQMDELFMRKSWNVVMRLGRVDAVIVLGDMLDSGRGVMTDREYEDYHSLFRSIFQLPPGTPMHFVPGNHDIPIGPNKLFSPQARERYASHFSPPNAILEIANHTIIMLDAVGLVEEDYRNYAAEMQFGEWDGVEGGVIEFVKDLRDNPPPDPRILISHIPLARPEASTCGPLREKGRILKGAGPGYQNLLGSETSRFLLDALKPSVVFSGDDHDYCEHQHPSGVKEVTIKSFSSSTGIRRPGFQLLSLVPPQPSTYSAAVTHADRPCLLPDQLGVYYRVYIPLGILTILYLFGTNIRAAWQRWSANRNSLYYGDLKSRASPAMMNADTLPSNPTLSARRGVSDRPVPLTLPSRKSSQQLAGTGATMATPGVGSRSLRYASNPSTEQLGANRIPSSSAPVSPYSSPRLSFVDERPAYSHHQSSGLGRMDEDVEAQGQGRPYENGHGLGLGNGHSSPTPSVSRRSSYIYMNDTHQRSAPSGLGNRLSETPDESDYGAGSGNASYFLPLPGSNTGAGLGFTTPQGSHFPFNNMQQPLRRVSSSTLSLASQHPLTGMTGGAGAGGGGNGSGSGSGTGFGGQLISPAPIRRVTMPRMLSTSEWSTAASKKDKSMFDFMVNSAGAATGMGGSGRSRGAGVGAKLWQVLETLKRFSVWLWRARNGVVAKSWRETAAVAWPAAVVWVIVNALFFRS